MYERCRPSRPHALAYFLHIAVNRGFSRAPRGSGAAKRTTHNEED